ncbi:M23 family metallopeptidase [Ruminiclostridium herbifermentans]|uniref:M23 family metallopeptidase n=1 Tax=Ruminiclostridium herbifermentans TaxID=2488810 RepID=A0A4U7JD13_9FIRM|nr:M23 family metallopeptidase [Ruminiclostridium herbifermentans]QNU68043.1 M23 family metallopeptidase [Ruminiclostridium herbifermentans]
MNEITMRPKYSRQTGTQRNRRREPDNDLLSIKVAVQLLVVVVFLSIFALCKAANTPATKSLVAKVNVVTTTNYDSNKYIKKIVTALGINLPEKGLQTENLIDGSQQQQEFDNNSEISENSDNLISENNSSSSIDKTDKKYDTTADEQIADTSTIEVLSDSEIKAIADKYSFIVPIKGEYVSLFGTRTDALTGKSSFHSGIDIGANMGTSIKAALAGEVIEVGSSPEYGNYIKLQHNDGMKTIYAYCSTLIAKKGQKVNQGDVIAKVGDTEGLSGSLHFEVWKDNKAVDPEKLLNYLNISK